MIMNSIKRLLFNYDDEPSPSLEWTGKIEFALKIDDLVIGYLRAADSIWSFEYSEAFRNQEKYRRLVGFSDLNKTYTSDVLWPFFKIRIPGLKQPMVKEIIQEEDLDVTNEAQLLERFGRKSMSNPYILELS